MEVCSAGLRHTMCRPLPQITVNVESVFEEGMVVRFIDSSGVEYRGAMLSQTTTEPSFQEPGLANPLTFVHDHPYSNLQKYAKHISAKIPPEAMLSWNSFPEACCKENLKAIEAHRNLAAVPQQNQGLVENLELSLPQVRRATVVTDPIREEPSSFSYPNTPSVLGGRAAKKVANSRMFFGRDSFYSDPGEFAGEKKSSKRSKMRKTGPTVTQKSKKKPTAVQAVQTFSRVGTNKQCSSPVSSDGSSQSSFPLKELSIPLVRVQLLHRFTSPLTNSMSVHSPRSSVSTSSRSSYADSTSEYSPMSYASTSTNNLICTSSPDHECQ